MLHYWLYWVVGLRHLFVGFLFAIKKTIVRTKRTLTFAVVGRKVDGFDELSDTTGASTGSDASVGIVMTSGLVSSISWTTVSASAGSSFISFFAWLISSCRNFTFCASFSLDDFYNFGCTLHLPIIFSPVHSYPSFFQVALICRFYLPNIYHQSVCHFSLKFR